MTLPQQGTTEYIRYHNTEGQHDEFVDAYDRAAVYLRGSPVSLSYHLSQCEEEPDCFIVTCGSITHTPMA
jgi:hypothetical protein